MHSIVFPYNVRPPSFRLVLSPSNYSCLHTINHSEIGVMCTNLAIDRGPHIVGITTIFLTILVGIGTPNTS